MNFYCKNIQIDRRENIYFTPMFILQNIYVVFMQGKILQSMYREIRDTL